MNRSGTYRAVGAALILVPLEEVRRDVRRKEERL
jgi:chaperonin cofactor prefoldin